MSRNKIVAARTTLAALGLGFAAMQVASANSKDERANPINASAREPAIGQCFRPELPKLFRTASANSSTTNNNKSGGAGSNDGGGSASNRGSSSGGNAGGGFYGFSPRGGGGTGTDSPISSGGSGGGDAAP